MIGTKSLSRLFQEIMGWSPRNKNKSGLMIKVPGQKNGNLITKNFLKGVLKKIGNAPK